MFGRLTLSATLVALATAGPALSGDTYPWYPRECIAIDYCSVVESVAWVVPDGANTPRPMVSSAHGRAIVPKSISLGESGDGRMHVCLRYDPFGSLEVTCLLVPSRLF
jgi:hypothetical protein